MSPFLQLKNGNGILVTKVSNTHLGGEDCGNGMLNYLVEEFKNETGGGILWLILGMTWVPGTPEERKVGLSVLILN